MLQAIRSRAGSVVVKLLFGALILSFGVWGIGDIFRDQSSDTVVASVGSSDIRAEELQQALQPALERLRAQLGSAVDLQQAKQFGIVDSVLGQLVDRSLFDQEVGRLRLDVADDVVRNAIYENPNFRGPDGKFDRAQFNQVLSVNHLTEDQFVALLRHDIPRSDLVHALTAGIVAPKPIIDTIYAYRDQKRIAAYVALPLSAAADVGQPSDDELKKFYDAHQDLFRTAEFRGFTLASLKPADLEHEITIPEDKLKQAFTDRQDEFQTPERRDVQQILSPSEEKAKEAQAALAKGQEWNEVATKVAGMDPDAIDLGLLKRQEMPGQLADIAFALTLNTPSEPVKTPLGWHILRVVKIDPGATQTFDQVKPTITAELQHEEAIDRIYKIANDVDDALAGGKSLADVASKYGLKTTVVAAADVGGRDPDGKPVPLPVSAVEVMKAAFATGEGQKTRVTETQDNAIFVLQTDKVVAPSVKPLADVKDKAILAWQGEKKQENVTKEAGDLAAAVTPDMPLAKVAAAKGLTVTTSPPLLRRADPNAKLPPAVIAKLFESAPGTVATGGDATGAIVAQLEEVQTPQAPAEAATMQMTQTLEQSMRADIAAEFTEALRHRYPVDIRRDALNKMF